LGHAEVTRRHGALGDNPAGGATWRGHRALHEVAEPIALVETDRDVVRLQRQYAARHREGDEEDGEACGSKRQQRG
jgi:hypothetical protein